jgi:hypothetical protein
LLSFPLYAHAFRSFFTPNPLRIPNPNTTEKSVVLNGRLHLNLFGKCTSSLLMAVKSHHA